MHELSIAAAIVETTEEAARRHGASAVESVRLRVGELSGVVAGALRFSFEVAAEDTLLAGAQLVIEEVPGRARCAPCDQEFAVGSPPRLCCPRCTAPTAELVAGRELEIAAVTLPDDGACPVAGHAPSDRASDSPSDTQSDTPSGRSYDEPSDRASDLPSAPSSQASSHKGVSG